MYPKQTEKSCREITIVQILSILPRTYASYEIIIAIRSNTFLIACWLIRFPTCKWRKGREWGEKRLQAYSQAVGRIWFHRIHCLPAPWLLPSSSTTHPPHSTPYRIPHTVRSNDQIPVVLLIQLNSEDMGFDGEKRTVRAISEWARKGELTKKPLVLNPTADRQ